MGDMQVLGGVLEKHAGIVQVVLLVIVVLLFVLLITKINHVAKQRKEKDK